MLNSVSLYLRLRTLLWDRPVEGAPFWRAASIMAGRVAWAVARDLIEGRLNLRAMSLVYTTLLSLVPALAIGFAIFRAFGFDSYIESMLAEFLGPLGEQGSEITQRVMEFVNRVNANVLGTVGFAFLLYTVVSMIKKIEEAFNSIWHVSANRSLARRFTEIVSMGVLGPLVLFTAVGIMASTVANSFLGGLADVEPFRFLLAQMSRVVPYAILIGTFAVLYMAIPNTRVTLGAALAGASVAGIVWGATGWAFATFVVKSAQYVAIYSAFASLVVFMIWLYAAWLILLVGCDIAFYVQNRRHLSPEAGLGLLSARQRVRMAVHLLFLVHEAFGKGQTPWTDEAVSRRLHVPIEAVGDIARALGKAGLVTHSATRPSPLLPGAPANLVRIADVFAVLRKDTETGGLDERMFAREPKVDAFFARLSDAETHVLDGTTIADLLGEAAKGGGDVKV